MLEQKDKYEMLVTRKELAVRYHSYLAKQLDERRTLYVHINLDGGRADSAQGAQPRHPDAPAVRVKIRSGQTAEYLAARILDKCAIGCA